MLILEGTDLVGKTTLAHNILKDQNFQEAGYVYKHLSRLPNGFHRYYGYIENAVRRSVQDRFHMSELAYRYGRRDQDAPMLTPERYRRVDAHLRTLGSFTVVIVASEALLTERFANKTREEMYQQDVIRRANEFFEDVMARQGWKSGFQMDIDYLVRLDTTHPVINDEAIEQIKTLYWMRQWETSAIENERTLRA